MKILVRLPNWLGDVVMSVGAVRQLQLLYPEAGIHFIIKKGLEDLVPLFAPAAKVFVFNKTNHPGPRGLWAFGRSIAKTAAYDLFVSFPDSFSSALMGKATGAAVRIGYKKEGRGLLLTQSFAKPTGLHRVEEYVNLVERFGGQKAGSVTVTMEAPVTKGNVAVVNINSEATSRRLTEPKAVEIISALRERISNPLVLVGGSSEQAFAERVFRRLPDKSGVESVAGKTSLKELCNLLGSARILLTTDSGPAHLANALGTHTVALFGAGNENNTAPYNKERLDVVRLGKLSCEPCVRNECVQFGTPQCLELLDTPTIVALVQKRINA